MIFRRNVLIFHQGALGDFVLTWPLAMAMGRMFPQSRIIYVSPASKGKLAERAVRVESSDVEAGWHTMFGQSPTVPEPVAKLLAGAHTIFSYVSLDGDVFDHNLHAIAPHAKLYTMSTREHASTGHAAEWAVDDLRFFPAAAEAVRQMLRSIAGRGVGVPRLPSDLVLLHPGSGSSAKNWPIEKFLELARELHHAGRPARFVIGEVEIDRWPSETIAKLESVATIQRPATYLELFDLIRTAAAFVGNDSGPGHLAAIMGVPTVSIFLATDADVWHPIGPARRIVRGDASPSNVMKSLNEMLSTLPTPKLAAPVADD